MNYKILIADDKPIVLRSFEDALANHLDITADFFQNHSRCHQQV